MDNYIGHTVINLSDLTLTTEQTKALEPKLQVQVHVPVEGLFS